MKEIKVVDTLLKEYKDADLVHYLATQLKRFNSISLEDADWNDYTFGAIMTDIEHLSEIASAVDNRMNKNSSSDPKIML